jgi:hypothetical protein
MVTRRRQHNHFVTSQQVESLVQLLAVTHAQYVGFMQWQATCALATDVEQARVDLPCDLLHTQVRV